MQLYQENKTFKAYKIFSIIWVLMIPWNLFMATGAALTNQIASFPDVLKSIFLIWVIISTVGLIASGLTIKGSSIVKSNGLKLLIMILMTISSLLPSLVVFLISR